MTIQINCCCWFHIAVGGRFAKFQFARKASEIFPSASTELNSKIILEMESSVITQIKVTVTNSEKRQGLKEKFKTF